LRLAPVARGSGHPKDDLVMTPILVLLIGVTLRAAIG
jgi:hypothetical protein